MILEWERGLRLRLLRLPARPHPRPMEPAAVLLTSQPSTIMLHLMSKYFFDNYTCTNIYVTVYAKTRCKSAKKLDAGRNLYLSPALSLSLNSLTLIIVSSTPLHCPCISSLSYDEKEVAKLTASNVRPRAKYRMQWDQVSNDYGIFFLTTRICTVYAD